MDKHIIINIGRQFGSGGKSVAAALSSKLGIPVYDNELLTKAAEQSGFSHSIFKESDEKRRFLSFGFLFGDNDNPGGLDDAELFKYQSETIRKIASEGSAIFVGRASDYVLRDMDCLDVFICAPVGDRAARVSGRSGVSLKEAETLVVKQDRQREKYYNFFTFGNWGVASNYDLCVDSSLLGIEGTADFIIDFGRKAGLI